MNTWPLEIRHSDATRVLTRNTTRIILTRNVKPGTYELHDQLIVRKNARHVKQGHWDQQQDPEVATVTITGVDETTLVSLDLATVRACGYKTQRDFYDEWFQARGHIEPAQPVRVCYFKRAEQPRLLHRRVHRGYTSNPNLAAQGEPEALSKADLKLIAGAAERRFERERRAEQMARRARSLREQTRAAFQRQDWAEYERLGLEQARLAQELRAA